MGTPNSVSTTHGKLTESDPVHRQPHFLTYTLCIALGEAINPCHLQTVVPSRAHISGANAVGLAVTLWAKVLWKPPTAAYGCVDLPKLYSGLTSFRGNKFEDYGGRISGSKGSKEYNLVYNYVPEVFGLGHTTKATRR